MSDLVISPTHGWDGKASSAGKQPFLPSKLLNSLRPSFTLCQLTKHKELLAIPLLPLQMHICHYNSTQSCRRKERQKQKAGKVALSLFISSTIPRKFSPNCWYPDLPLDFRFQSRGLWVWCSTSKQSTAKWSLFTVSETHSTRLLSCSPHGAELLGQHTLEMGWEVQRLKTSQTPRLTQQLLHNMLFTVPGLTAPEHS